MKGSVKLMRKKRFTPEYKEEIIKLVTERRKKISEVAKDIGVTSTSIRRWITQYSEYGKDAFPGKGNLRAEDDKIRKLMRDNIDLKEENKKDHMEGIFMEVYMKKDFTLDCINRINRKSNLRFKDINNRNQAFLILTQNGYNVKKTVSKNQCIHPEYLEDYAFLKKCAIVEFYFEERWINTIEPELEKMLQKEPGIIIS